MDKNKKAAIYIRVSTDAQFEEGYSVDAQKEQLTAYCVSKNIKEYEYYVDGGWSGSNLQRPEMQRLIDDVKNNKISHCIVYKLDRLSRSQKDVLYVIEDLFLPYGVNFVSLTESLDTSTPMGRAMIGILAAFAQLERENIRMRTRMGMTERVKEGYWMGGGKVPFGYDYNSSKGVLEPNKDAEKVKKIYQLFLEGYSRQTIADILDLKYEKIVDQILKRKTNIGIIEYNGKEYKGKHQAIIDEDTYYRVMRVMADKASKNLKTTKSTHLLSGLVYCGQCGAKMRYQSWTKDKRYKLVCYSQQHSKPYLVKDPNCTQERIWADEVESVVIRDIFSISVKQLENTEDTPKKPSIADMLRDEIVNLDRKLKRLFSLYAQSNDEVLLEVINEHRAKRHKLLEQLKLEEAAATKQVSKEDILDSLKNISDLWNYMSDLEKQTLIRNVINKVELTHSNIHIDYKL